MNVGLAWRICREHGFDCLWVGDTLNVLIPWGNAEHGISGVQFHPFRTLAELYGALGY